MSNGSNLRLAFVIEAIDRATATVTRVNKVIDKVTEPLRRVRAATTALLRESRFDKLKAAWSDLGERGQGLLNWGRGVATMMFAVGAAAGGAGYALKSNIDSIDRALDQSKKLGITVAEYQRMGFAAQMNGSSADEMGQALQFLSQNMVEAVNGSKEAAAWFARVGIPLEALKKMNAAQVIDRIADTFLRVGDTGQNAAKKIALTRALMGRGGAELVQTLNLGSAGLRRFYKEADTLGGVVSQEAAEGMADFNDEFDRMRFAAGGAMTAISRAALPALNDLVKRTTAWTVANRDLVATRVQDFVEKILPKLPAFAAAVVDVTGAVAALILAANTVAQALGGWETVMAVVAGVIIGKGIVAVWGLTAAVWGLGVAMWATPIGWLIAGIAGLAAAAGLVIKYWEPIATFFTGLWETVSKVVGAFFSVAKPTGRAPSIYAGGDEWAKYRAGQRVGGGLGGLAGSGELGGTLRIEVNGDGRVARTDVRKASGGLVDFEVHTGRNMAGP